MALLLNKFRFRSLALSRVSKLAWFTTLERSSLICRTAVSQFHLSSKIQSKQQEDEELNDEPIKYSTSKARKLSSYDTFLVKRSAPWYQAYIVLGSTFVFFVYFFVLREENDLDEEFQKSLFDRVPGLEEQDLKAKIVNANSMGLDSSVYEKRLKEIQLYK